MANKATFDRKKRHFRVFKDGDVVRIIDRATAIHLFKMNIEERPVMYRIYPMSDGLYELGKEDLYQHPYEFGLYVGNIRDIEIMYTEKNTEEEY